MIEVVGVKDYHFNNNIHKAQWNYEDVYVFRVEEIKHNLWTGALEGHKITTFYDYRKPTKDDFNVALGEDKTLLKYIEGSNVCSWRCQKM